MPFLSIHSSFRFISQAYIASKTASLATSISAVFAASYGGGEVFYFWETSLEDSM